MPEPTPPLTRTQAVILGVLFALILAVLIPIGAWTLHRLWSWGFAWA